MRPSLDCAASTFEEARTFRSRSTRRLARFSVITTWVPLSLRFAVKTALRGSYEVNFRRGLRVSADSEDVLPVREICSCNEFPRGHYLVW